MVKAWPRLIQIGLKKDEDEWRPSQGYQIRSKGIIVNNNHQFG